MSELQDIQYQFYEELRALPYLESEDIGHEMKWEHPEKIMNYLLDHIGGSGVSAS